MNYINKAKQVNRNTKRSLRRTHRSYEPERQEETLTQTHCIGTRSITAKKIKVMIRQSRESKRERERESNYLPMDRVVWVTGVKGVK